MYAGMIPAILKWVPYTELGFFFFYQIGKFNSFNLLISVEIMNLLTSSIHVYKHLKINLIKHKQSLILGKCESQLISVFSNTTRGSVG